MEGEEEVEEDAAAAEAAACRQTRMAVSTSNFHESDYERGEEEKAKRKGTIRRPKEIARREKKRKTTRENDDPAAAKTAACRQTRMAVSTSNWHEKHKEGENTEKRQRGRFRMEGVGEGSKKKPPIADGHEWQCQHPFGQLFFCCFAH